METKRKRFTLCHNSHNAGFHMQFENGFTISVQWGAGNYGDFHGLSRIPEHPEFGKDWVESDRAEVAVFDPADRFYRVPGFMVGDDVRGYLTSDEVLEIMQAVSRLSWDENLQIVTNRD